MDPVRLIDRSFWCYRAGWASLIPILGLIPAVLAFYWFGRVRSDLRGDWNPAGSYLWAGFVLGFVGSAESLLLIAQPLFTYLWT